MARPKTNADLPEVVREAVARSTDDIHETIGIESHTIQEQIIDLSTKVTDISIDLDDTKDDISTMLAGLQKIFEPQLKAKAFAIFDETSASIRSRGITRELKLHDSLVEGEAWHQLGIRPPTQNQFFEEWKKQKEQQSKVSAK